MTRIAACIFFLRKIVARYGEEVGSTAPPLGATWYFTALEGATLAATFSTF